VWCSSITDEAIGLQIEKDPHSPPNFRVMGSLSNLPEFAETFNCPAGEILIKDLLNKKYKFYFKDLQ
jgi:predicted metalloendopeptidase